MAICRSLGIEQRDLFLDALDSDPLRRWEMARQRDRLRHFRERKASQEGALIDALRQADVLVQSRQDLEIDRWTDEKLDDELNTLGDAYRLLESEALHG